jgi:uncharacterized repeat protein (TIGR01451 family)
MRLSIGLLAAVVLGGLTDPGVFFQRGDLARGLLYVAPAMPRVARRVWVVLVLAGWLVVLAAVPTTASAFLEISFATLNGATSISSPPGGVMEARVRGRTTAGDVWRGTQYRFGDGAWQCVNTPDRSGDNVSVEFYVAAPGDPAEYEVRFRARDRNDCGGAESNLVILGEGIRVTTPASNPNIPPRCGIDVMLVLDKSGSIASSGATQQVRNATGAFLTALSGTGADMSIVDFSTRAERPVGYTTVTPGTIASVFEPYLENQYNPSGWTNWEDAFHKVREANTQGTVADLVVFVTDGDPTARNTDSGGVVTDLVEGDVTALTRAVGEADQVKGQDSHVFALGVGAAVTDPLSARRLTAVSGFEQYPNEPFSRADYTLVEDFANLAAALRRIAVELCEASVTVTKLVDEGDGTFQPDPGWSFTADVEMSEGGYTWLQPAPPPSTGPRSEITNDAGVDTFQWRPSNATATSSVTLTEQVEPGYQFDNWDCQVTGRRRRLVRRMVASAPVIELDLGPNQFVKCNAFNRIQPGTIEIEKNATPESSQAFDFTGSLGNFALVDDRADGSGSRTFTNLGPGTYTVSESVPANWQLRGISCTPEQAAVVSGTQVTITLAAGSAVVCTYNDRRVEPPTPPEPPHPPVPPPPIPPVPPVPPPPPPPTPPLTELRVVKTAPRVARVGQRVPFRLTVRNVGSVAARKVLLADVPPAAVTLAGLRTTGRVRVVRGDLMWRLGRLAPGARRTVRGTVRIQAARPGRVRNLAFATAVNAKIADDRTDTRILRRRRPTPVTG